MSEIFIVEHLKTKNVEVQLRRFDFQTPHTGRHMPPEKCRVDFSLTPRPSNARGTYLERWLGSRYERIGDVMFVPPQAAYRGSCGVGNSLSLTCFIHPDLFEIDTRQLDDHALAETFDVRNRAVRRTLSRILREVSQPTFVSPLAIEAAGMLLAADLSLSFRGVNAAPSHKKGGLAPAKLRIIEDRIRAPLPLPRITELARACGVTERHLSRAFQAESGRALGEYIAGVGVERAQHLLLHSDLSVKQIALDLGFASGAGFASAFRRATGLRPSEARAIARR